MGTAADSRLTQSGNHHAYQYFSRARFEVASAWVERASEAGCAASNGAHVKPRGRKREDGKRPPCSPADGRQASWGKTAYRTRKSTVRRLWAALVASDRPLRLIEFVVGSKKPTQQPGGKRGPVKAKAWGKTKTYRGAFIAPQKKGSNKTTVYVRKSEKRLPLKQLFGPGIMQLFRQRENASVMERKVQERLPKEFMQNLAYYISRIRRI